MTAKRKSLQDLFLNAVRRARSPVVLFLVKGVRLQGVITWFDAFSLLLRRDGASQLVYKHSVSTISPQDLPPEILEQAGQFGSGTSQAKAGLQDLYLAAAMRERETMTVFLVNGVMLTGKVAGYDQFSVLLERGGQIQMIYKHAVSTLQSEAPLTLEVEQAEPEDTPE